jgi:predicted metal-dependent peptidase
MSFSIEERLVQARIFLMRSSPFFATLLLNAQVTITEDIPTAATDGSSLLMNPEFMEKLSDSEFTAVICHEVLHMAFNHAGRYKELPDPPDPDTKKYFFNYAADIIVNGVVALVPGLDLPDGHIRDQDLEDKSLPEVYAALLEDPPFNIQKINICMSGEGGGQDDGDDEGAAAATGSEEYWDEVLERAKQAEQMGNSTSSILRKINGIQAEATMDWRRALSEWIVPASFSWGGYDRRFIYDDYYVDTDQTDGLTLRVFIDTSGSVCEQTLAEFISEIKDNIALSNWAKIDIEGYFFDTELYGPHLDIDELLKPVGFGGTDFDPIMNLIKESPSFGSEVNIIFTDGYSDIPRNVENNVVWILGSASGQTRAVFDFLNKGWTNVYKFKRGTEND